MGYSRTYGSATEAPVYQSNSIGTPSWSGKKASEMTPDIISDLNQFIHVEARLQGWNDSAQDRIGENEEFFHEEFLSGWPYRLWSVRYRKGVNEQQGKSDNKPEAREIWAQFPI